MTRPHADAEKSKQVDAPKRSGGAPAPDVWSAAIIQALSEAEEPMTQRQIIDRVGKIVNTPTPGPIPGELDVLQTYDFLAFDDSTRRFFLTPEGKALSVALAKESRH